MGSALDKLNKIGAKIATKRGVVGKTVKETILSDILHQEILIKTNNLSDKKSWFKVDNTTKKTRVRVAVNAINLEDSSRELKMGDEIQWLNVFRECIEQGEFDSEINIITEKKKQIAEKLKASRIKKKGRL